MLVWETAALKNISRSQAWFHTKFSLHRINTRRSKMSNFIAHSLCVALAISSYHPSKKRSSTIISNIFYISSFLLCLITGFLSPTRRRVDDLLFKIPHPESFSPKAIPSFFYIRDLINKLTFFLYLVPILASIQATGLCLLVS